MKNNRPLFVITFLIFAFIMTASVPQAYANDRLAGTQDKTQTTVAHETQKRKKHSQKTDDLLSTFKAIEPLGLQATIYEGGLGQDLWNNTRRSQITTLLKALPVTARNKSVQDLIRGLLLTSTSIKKLDNDVDDPQEGDDLLTLRLSKLNEMGAYQDAFNLYSKISESPYHPRLIEQGILAMILSGQKSLACIEARSAAEIFVEDAFLGQIITFCEADWDKDVITTMISKEDVAASLKTFESALLISTNKDDTLPFTVSQALTLPAKDILPALIHTDLSLSVRTALNIHAYDFGLITLKDLEKAYVVSDGMSDGKNKEKESDNLDIVSLYQDFTRAEQDQKWNIFTEALALKESYNISAFAPFLKGLKTAALPDSISPKILQQTYQIFIHTNKHIPEKFFQPLLEPKSKNMDSDLHAKMLAIAALSTKNNRKKKGYISALEDISSQTTLQTRLELTQLFETSEKIINFKEAIKLSYENKINLTFNSSYVIHSANTSKHLLEATHSDRRGEVVLISVIVLNARDQGSLYPPHLQNVLIGLSEVGLNNIARNVAFAVLLGDETKKRN